MSYKRVRTSESMREMAHQMESSSIFTLPSSHSTSSERSTPRIPSVNMSTTSLETAVITCDDSSILDRCGTMSPVYDRSPTSSTETPEFSDTFHRCVGGGGVPVAGAVAAFAQHNRNMRHAMMALARQLLEESQAVDGAVRREVDRGIALSRKISEAQLSVRRSSHAVIVTAARAEHEVRLSADEVGDDASAASSSTMVKNIDIDRFRMRMITTPEMAELSAVVGYNIMLAKFDDATTALREAAGKRYSRVDNGELVQLELLYMQAEVHNALKKPQPTIECLEQALALSASTIEGSSDEYVVLLAHAYWLLLKSKIAALSAVDATTEVLLIMRNQKVLLRDAKITDVEQLKLVNQVRCDCLKVAGDFLAQNSIDYTRTVKYLCQFLAMVDGDACTAEASVMDVVGSRNHLIRVYTLTGAAKRAVTAAKDNISALHSHKYKNVATRGTLAINFVANHCQKNKRKPSRKELQAQYYIFSHPPDTTDRAVWLTSIDCLIAFYKAAGETIAAAVMTDWLSDDV